MANKVISMQQLRVLIQLLEKGFSLRSIAIQLGISRPTISIYAERIKKTGYTLEALRHLNDADLSSLVYAPPKPIDYSDDQRRVDFIARTPYFLSELKRTGVTRFLLWEAYRKEYNSPYGYTQFCALLKDAIQPSRATMHLVHTPAEMVMVDFEGVPLSLKTDNMKQVVTKSCRYEPIFSEVLLQWALHNNITLLATRVAKPKDKGAVENEVKIAYQRIYAPLRDEIFHHIDELNAAALKQLAMHNEKLFQLKDHSRLQQFKQEEQFLLQPLPTTPFVIKHQVSAKVQKNYHITLGENYHHYSVPYQFIGKQVSVVYDTDIVEVYYQRNRIALHKRGYKKHDYTTTGDHMPAGHQYYYEAKGLTPSYFLEQASRIGSSVHQYMDMVLKARAYTEQTFNACKGILRLHQQYGTTRLEAACTRALFGSIFNYRTLQNILLNHLDQLDQPNQMDLFRLPEHPNLRGPDAYQ